MPFVPAVVVTPLVQWTLLLALGWLVHAGLRGRHPRSRLLLWRGILCCGLLVPAAAFLHLPRINIAAPGILSDSTDLTAAVPSVEPITRFPPPGVVSSIAPSTYSTPRPAVVQPITTIAWPHVLLGLWGAGALWHLVRLARLHARMRRAAAHATPAANPVQQIARQIRQDLGLRYDIQVCNTAEFPSPVLCGIVQPKILIPQGLLDQLTPAQLRALLTHEMAHQCRHDLIWLLAWRLMRAVYWFHPLIWKIPDAHVLACEEEADRIAADRFHEGDGYMPELARLVLQLVQPTRESRQLGLSAASHIGRRLNQLRNGGFAGWTRKHTLIGIAAVGVLVALAAGWEFGQKPTPIAAVATKPAAMNTVLLTVLNTDRQPIEGATITPISLHTSASNFRGSGFGWRPLVYGPIEKAITDQSGKAVLKYPVYIDTAEKIPTAKISLQITHREFSFTSVNAFPVDGSGKAIELTRGRMLRVSGYVGASHEPVTEIVPVLLGEDHLVRDKDWQPDGNGHLTWPQMSPGKHFLHVSGRLRSGELVYSDGEAFFGEQSDNHDIAVEMKPGVRIEGRIDRVIPRPIKNGWVQLSVNSDDAAIVRRPFSMPIYTANTGFWWSYRPIAADGTFVFESVPAGDFKVIAYGDGFMSSNGPLDMRPIGSGPRLRFEETKSVTRGVPQSFACVRPVTRIQIAAERTATLKVTAKANGKPVAGATIHVSPNVIQMPSGSRIFGQPSESSEAPFRTLPALPPPTFSAITDSHGVAVITNLPTFTHEFGVMDPRYEAPMHFSASRNASSRYNDITLKPGQTTETEITLQPKGSEFLGLDR